MAAGTLAVTGANGHLGRRLLAAMAGQPVRALVRSESAARQVGERSPEPSVAVRVVDYRDAADMAHALEGCDAVVHLVGILKEGAGSRYRDAHQDSCRALAEAAGDAGVRRLVYLSILGADAGSINGCLASKGEAEQILLGGAVPVSVIRVPMVLGEGDYASRALAGRARRRVNVLLRGASLEQPIYVADVVEAMLAARQGSGASRTYDLAGPESLPRAALVERAARALGRSTRVLSLPLGCGLAAAWLLERLMDSPPVTRDMLGVLDHDDRVNPEAAVAALDLRLTSLDDMLERVLSDAGR